MKLRLHLPEGKTLNAEVNDTGVAGAHAWFERLSPLASAVGPGQFAEVALDWAVLRLEAHADEVRVFEPDYSVADLNRFVPGAAATDQVFSAQVRLTQMLHVVPEPVRASQYVRVAKSALSGMSAFGYRFAETESEFTGWQISSAASSDGEAFGQYSVGELAHQHLAWLVALCLPTGWSFRCAGHTLIDCVAPSGQTDTVMLSIDA